MGKNHFWFNASNAVGFCVRNDGIYSVVRLRMDTFEVTFCYC